jgi:hypothetical protein
MSIANPNLSTLRCERSYKRTGHKFQVRTHDGRLVASGDAVESVEHHTLTGRDRTLWRRVSDMGRTYWLAR